MNVLDHPLHRLPKYGDGIGLHRVQFLMRACGIEPEDISRRAVAITGSNGKGSTARIAAALLGTTGGPVGLFTSPHLYRYNERFCINGEAVDDAALLKAMDAVQKAVVFYCAQHGDAVGAFEAQFVAALLMLQRCRWLVLEAGIGGRYDPVRLALAPAGALVSLDLEHTALLGNTLVEIACDKLDATAPGGLVVLGENCIGLAGEIRAYASLSAKRVEFVEPQGWHDEGVRNGRQHFSIADSDFHFRDLSSSLVGRHQINNHAVAIALVRERLRQSGAWPMPDAAARWRDAIADVAWPGRLETICHDPLVVIDVGHTPEAIAAALAGFRALAGDRDALLVTGGSRNKQVREMLALLVPAFDQIICTAAHHNGLPAQTVAEMARTMNLRANVNVCTSIGEAVARARDVAGRSKRAVYVAGGLFLAAEFAEAWRGHDPAMLRFF